MAVGREGEGGGYDGFHRSPLQNSPYPLPLLAKMREIEDRFLCCVNRSVMEFQQVMRTLEAI